MSRHEKNVEHARRIIDLCMSTDDSMRDHRQFIWRHRASYGFDRAYAGARAWRELRSCAFPDEPVMVELAKFIDAGLEKYEGE